MTNTKDAIHRTLHQLHAAQEAHDIDAMLEAYATENSFIDPDWYWRYLRDYHRAADREAKRLKQPPPTEPVWRDAYVAESL